MDVKRLFVHVVILNGSNIIMLILVITVYFAINQLITLLLNNSLIGIINSKNTLRLKRIKFILISSLILQLLIVIMNYSMNLLTLKRMILR